MKIKFEYYLGSFIYRINNHLVAVNKEQKLIDFLEHLQFWSFKIFFD
jgi:hypothetical protein